MQYYEQIQKGFRILHPQLAGYIGLELSRFYRERWWNEVLEALNDRNLPLSGSYDELIDSLDIANCLRLLERKWNDLFYNRLNRNCRTWAKELMGVRNEVAHIGQRDFSQGDAERHLDTMARLCAAFDEEGAEEIRELYRQVRQDGHPVVVQDDAGGPAPIDIPGQNGHISLQNARGGVDLLALIGTDVVQKTTLTRKVTYAGKTESYPVYKVRLDALYYNDQNDRIATWITRYRSEHGADALAQLNGERYNEVIGNFIYESNPESIQKTQKNIALVGQREPGVALGDGRIVDGNRRYTCLRRLQTASAEPLYFETVIMNVDIQRDKKQIKLLELAIQHGEEKKVDYDLIDYAVGTYIDVVKTQLLTLEEYASGTNESVAEVRKRIECAEVICEFLDYLKLPEQYHVARDLQVYSLFQEMMQPLKALTGDEKQQLKRIAFNNVLLHAVPDQRKFIRDIKGLIRNNAHAVYFADQEKLNERIHQKFDGETIRGKADLDRFAQANVQLAEEMQTSMQQALHRARNRQLKERPTENVAKIKTLLNEVDPRLFGKMEAGEKQELQQGLQEVSEMMDRFAEALAGKPMAQKSAIPDGPAVQPHVLKTAPADPKKPYVVCTSAGNPILRYFVSMRFQTVALSEHITGPTTCKAYFVNDDGEAISNVRIFTLEAGQIGTENFVMTPACQTLSSCRLIIQDADGADDEAMQVIPFELRISAGFRR